ncbi:MAG: leucine-rich repeat domain-containing protein [Clostridia bacterium]|nr:leucine-rich repeat domain-containing protein [Clostridia bacterium]
MKKALSILLSILLLFGTVAFALTANAEGEPTIVDQGYCGSYNNPNDVVWVLTDDGTLTVSGTGPMKDYSRNQVPWRSKRAQIQSIVIEDGVTTVGGFTFEQIPNLTSVSLPDSLEKIRQYAFARCTNLKSVEIPNGVTIIENDSFSVCGLTSVAIPDSVVTIEWYAFSDCRNMKTLTLGSGLKKIDYTAFVNCEALEQVILPDSLTYLGEGAFDNCESLTSFTIPAGVTYIQRNPVGGCRNLTEIKVAPENTVYHATGNCLIETETKTLISGCQASTIPRDGSVTSIKASAFYGTWGLKRIGIPISVTSIGEGAFGSCDQLRDVYYGGSEEQWNQIDIVYGSSSNQALVNANLHFNVWEWGFTGALGNELNVFYAYSTDGVLTISGTGAMTAAWDTSKPNRYRTLIIEDGVTNIINWGFFDCSNLSSVTIPNSVTSIGHGTFNGCRALTEITLPDGLTEIGGGAFELCTNIAKVTIPSSVTEIGGQAFAPVTVIYGYAGSAAEAFAAENGNAFVAICPTNAEHTVIKVEATVTCTEAGHTAGWYCEDCGAYLSGEAQPAVGHSWGEWEVIRPATVDEEGLMRRTCQNDPTHVEEQVIPKLKPNTNVFQEFIEMIKTFFENLTEWLRRLFRW